MDDELTFWEIWQTPLTVIFVIVGAIVLRWVLHFAIHHTVNRIVQGAKKKENLKDTQALVASPLAAVRVVQRTKALGGVFNSVVTAAIVIVTCLVLITILLPNATGAFAIISAAVGAGLGFGAQNVVKDVLNGLFMVGEDQLGVGDSVDLGEASGVVESVGIRVTQVRDVNGTLWFVRNGEITRVGNQSQGWARVIIDLPVPYHADIEVIEKLMLTTATELSRSPKWRRHVIEKPEIWGIESVTAQAVVVRLTIKVRTAEQSAITRELRLRLKRALDQTGISPAELAPAVIEPTTIQPLPINTSAAAVRPAGSAATLTPPGAPAGSRETPPTRTPTTQDPA